MRSSRLANVLANEDLLPVGYAESQSDPNIWEPQPGPQTQLLETEAFETLYGGAAGGGKSDGLLGLSLLNHKKSLLLRRTFPELQQTLIMRSEEIIQLKGRWNGSEKVWRYKDKIIKFGHMEHSKHRFSYQGSAWDFMGFDELTQFELGDYLYLLSRLRSVDRNQRVRVVGCTNPGGEGNDWVMHRWRAWLDDTYANPAMPGDLRWYANIDGNDTEMPNNDPVLDPSIDKMIQPMSRTFIPAKLSDNKYLSEEYSATLNILPEPYRSQLLYGDWQAGQQDDAYQVIPTAWVRAAMDRWTDERPNHHLTQAGLDVSGGGADTTVLYKRYGNWIDKPIKWQGKKTQDPKFVSDKVYPHVQDENRVIINIDAQGVGSGVWSNLKRDMGGRARRIIFSEGANRMSNGKKIPIFDKTKTFRFANVRAWLYWNVREILDPESGYDIALPPDNLLLGDLTAPRWKMRPTGIGLKEKEEIKKKLGRSPDDGDACALCLFQMDKIATGTILKSISADTSVRTGQSMTSSILRESKIW